MKAEGQRLLLEVLKFLSARELLGAAAVSRPWRQVADSPELWLSLLTPAGIVAWQSLKAAGHCPKSAYRRLHSPQVALIRGREILIYHFISCEWDRREVEAEGLRTEDAVITSVGDGAFFGCSSVGQPSNTFWVSGLTGKVEFLERVMRVRVYPGIVKYRDFVYSFCGRCDPACSKCERFHLQVKRWESVPNAIYIRHAFNPLLYEETIYLPFGNSPHIESFSPLTSQFSDLRIKSDFITSAASVLYGNTLISFGLSKSFSMSLTQSKKPVEKVMSKRPLRAWSAFDPVVEGDLAVLTWAYGDPWLIALIDLRTLECRTVPVPPSQ